MKKMDRNNYLLNSAIISFSNSTSVSNKSTSIVIKPEPGSFVNRDLVFQKNKMSKKEKENNNKKYYHNNFGSKLLDREFMHKWPIGELNIQSPLVPKHIFC